jgi:ATP adenylyltransferase
MEKNFFNNIDYNTVLLETNNFIVIPSLGSLVEGWLLIIPKKFHINLSQLDKSDIAELDQLVDRMEKTILPKFGHKYVLFEHGPRNENSKAGCGVDYAHLHFVPFEDNLIEGTKNFLNLDYTWDNIESISNLVNYKDTDSDYLFIKDQNGDCFITIQEDVQSQTFRKVIANYVGRPNNFDWKCNSNVENIYSTINKLSLIEA